MRQLDWYMFIIYTYTIHIYLGLFWVSLNCGEYRWKNDYGHLYICNGTFSGISMCFSQRFVESLEANGLGYMSKSIMYHEKN